MGNATSNANRPCKTGKSVAPDISFDSDDNRKLACITHTFALAVIHDTQKASLGRGRTSQGLYRALPKALARRSKNNVFDEIMPEAEVP